MVDGREQQNGEIGAMGGKQMPLLSKFSRQAVLKLHATRCMMHCVLVIACHILSCSDTVACILTWSR